jgi:LL-diaminopimelate aminotransferase
MKNWLWSERIANLPPYLFAEIDRIRTNLEREGVDVIDLSIGDPDLPTPSLIVDRMKQAVEEPKNHQYPAYTGSERFRQAVALWYEDRFGVQLNPNEEVLALIGSKEGIAHAPLAFINPGDVALVPNPGYPVYSTATEFAGGKPVEVLLDPSDGYKPNLAKISESDCAKAKLLFLNYPNNPTSATVDLGLFEEITTWAEKNRVLVCHDAAYTEVTYGGYEAPSVLQAKRGMETSIEFHSLSKTFNMTGWRIGFVVGNKDAIAGLGKIKTNVDSGIFGAIQEAGITALENWKDLRDQNNRIYEHRRDMVCEGLQNLGIEYVSPRASFYVWCRVPSSETSSEFCSRILQEVGIALTPGVGFGDGGEGCFRISFTASEVRLQEAISRLRGKI